MNNSFVKQYQDHLSLSYTCFDRLVFNGYIQGSFKESNVVHLLRNLNFKDLTNGVIRTLTNQLNAHITKYAEQNNIPIIWWDKIGGKNGAKKDYVLANHYSRSLGDTNRVLCILTTREFVKSATVRQFEKKDKSGIYNRLYIVEKPIKQYYIYLHDKDLGFCCLKISSYLPFHSRFYCNGHYIIQRELDKQGVDYKMHNNSFTWVSDIDNFKQITSSLPEGEWISHRIEGWMKVFFRFHKGNRSTCSKLLHHNWFINQTELSSNIIFKSPRYLQQLYREILAEQHVIGYPDNLNAIFESKRVCKKTSTKQRRFGTQACIKHWFRRNSIKMYNKGGCLLRVETTINSPDLPGRKLKKAVWNLQTYGWYSLGCNNRYFETIAKTDLSIVKDMGKLDKPVLVNGKRIAAPDLRKDFQIELLRILLRPKYLTFGFRTRDLQTDFAKIPKTSKIRYEISKLKSRGLIKKMQKSNYYVVTKDGWLWIWISLFQKDYFATPLLSGALQNTMRDIIDQKGKRASRIRHLNSIVSQLYQDFRIVA